MSKNISIAEGGQGKQMTVDKLKTNLVAGGTCLWVPEDEVDLGTKSISANGTYAAASDGKYGYSQVTVNVPGGAGGPPGEAGSSIVGTDPTDGEEYVERIDENGNIVKTLMPSGIQVTTPPTKTTYVAGETLDFTGIVVKLKKHDGTVYTDENYPDGAIPFSELTFPVTVAPESGHSYGDWSADPSWVCSTANAYLGRSGDRWFYKRTDGPAVVAFLVQADGWKGPLLISDVVIDAATNYNQNVESYVRDGKTWYFNHGHHYRTDDYDSGGLHIISAANSSSVEDLFNAMMEAANVQGGGGTGTEAIPVHWTPPKPKFLSQKTRATSFEITETAASGGTTVDDEGFSGTEGNF